MKGYPASTICKGFRYRNCEQMSCEWIQVVSDSRFGVLRQSSLKAISNSTPIAIFPDQVVSSNVDLNPFMITLTEQLPAWLDPDGVKGLQPSHADNATIRAAFNTNFVIWINSVDLFPTVVPDDEAIVGDQNCSDVLRRFSYTMSDIICFMGDDMQAVVHQLLDWARACSRLRDVEDRLIACVILLEHNINIDGDKINRNRSVKKDFMTACLKDDKAEDWEEETLKRDIFQRLKVFTTSGATNLLLREVNELLMIARRVRRARRHLWLQSIFKDLSRYAIETLATDEFATLDSVSLLISEAYSDSVQEKLWPELLKSASFSQTLEGFVIPVMSACFARSALRQKHSMYLSTCFPASSLYPTNTEQCRVQIWRNFWVCAPCELSYSFWRRSEVQIENSSLSTQAEALDARKHETVQKCIWWA